jgi:hypothetical protein
VVSLYVAGFWYFRRRPTPDVLASYGMFLEASSCAEKVAIPLSPYCPNPHCAATSATAAAHVLASRMGRQLHNHRHAQIQPRRDARQVCIFIIGM